MSVLPILAWPDPRLAQVCPPVAGEVSDLARDMLETMYAAPGRGLAAPQVGVLSRIFVMDAGWKGGTPTPRVCVNPEIVSASEIHAEGVEGCLSIPGLEVPVSRPEAVRLAYSDLSGARVVADLAGAEALIAQHELDHLNGMVTLDRVTPGLRADLVARLEAAP